MSSTSVSSTSVSSTSVSTTSSSDSSLPPITAAMSSSYNITPVIDCAGAEVKKIGDIAGIILGCCCAMIILFLATKGAPSPAGGMSGVTIFLYLVSLCCLSSSVNYMYSYYQHQSYLASASCAAISTSS